MFLKTFLPPAAAVLAVLISTALIPQSAWSADLRLKPRPAVEAPAAADWRDRLFQQFQRYLQRRNQESR
jgi:hypothetical protein